MKSDWDFAAERGAIIDKLVAENADLRRQLKEAQGEVERLANEADMFHDAKDAATTRLAAVEGALEHLKCCANCDNHMNSNCELKDGETCDNWYNYAVEAALANPPATDCKCQQYQESLRAIKRSVQTGRVMMKEEIWDIATDALDATPTACPECERLRDIARKMLTDAGYCQDIIDAAIGSKEGEHD